MLKFYSIIILSYVSLSSTEFDVESNPMCKEQNASCGYAFGELESNFCFMTYYLKNNKTICDNAYNKDVIKNENIDLGKLTLIPFEGDARTVFNVTFTDIKWKKLMIRFEVHEISKYMVKEFVLNETVFNKSFSYTCPWSDVGYEGRIAHFDYKYGITKYETEKKYKFFVPSHINHLERSRRNEELYLFLYVDYSDIYYLILKIVPFKNEFVVRQYKVKVIYTNEEQKYVKAENILNSEPNSDILEYSFYTHRTEGNYIFLVEPVCQNKKCMNKYYETPVISIDENPNLLFGIVGGVLLLIPVFLVIVYIWKRKWPGLLKQRKQPNILLVTFPTNDAHAIIAPVLADFLECTYNVKIILDINEISQTKSKNSLDWLNSAIQAASHIVFLRSNDELSDSQVIYKDIYSQTVHLLNPKFSDKKKECIILFPYSSEITDNSNPELIHIKKRFVFKKEKHFNKFIKFLNIKNVPKKVRENVSYRLLHKKIESIKGITNKNGQKEFNIQYNTSDDESDSPIANFKGKEDCDVKIDFDLEINVLGHAELENNNSVSDNDSDSLDINFMGNEDDISLKT